MKIKSRANRMDLERKIKQKAKDFKKEKYRLTCLLLQL